MKVKEPLASEYGFFREGLVLYTYLHLAPLPELTKALMQKKVRAIAYETIQLADGALPLLRPMSEVAGRLAVQVGASCLEKQHGGKGLLLGGVPGTRRGRVAIVGGGIVGSNAARIAVGLGAHVTVLDVNHERMAYLEDIFQGAIETLYSNPGTIDDVCAWADLVIGAVLVAGAKTPVLVTREHLRRMQPGSVVVDVAVDQGGCIETCRPTTHDNPDVRRGGRRALLRREHAGRCGEHQHVRAHERDAQVRRGHREQGRRASSARRRGARARRQLLGWRVHVRGGVEGRRRPLYAALGRDRLSHAPRGPRRAVSSAVASDGATLDGRYRILEVLGEGGMGTVHSAIDLGSGEMVAVKTLWPELAAKPASRERFEREARALFALDHPHVVDVRDFGIADGVPYIVTELLVGRTLEQAIDAAPLEPGLAVRYAREILSALAFSHAQGVVHRDLKSANVFLKLVPGRGEVAKLLDFGLVRFIDGDQWGTGATLTADGEVMGSPGYISPEQTCGQRADATSDVYSAGCLLFELLTGRWPFEKETRTAMFRAHLLETPPSLREARPGLVARKELESLVARALAKKREDRFRDAVAMLSALDAVPDPRAWLG